MKSDIILERLMSLHPKIIDLTLDRMTRLLNLLGNPEKQMPPTIHIAGTNGKGSTQAMIRAGLEASGDICHAYTSPHLARFHERIFLSGSIIEEQDLANYLSECEKVNGNIPTNLFTLNSLNPHNFGYLMATWEHRTFLTSQMLQINPFDQYGVSAGKIFTKKYLEDHGG